MIRYRHQRHVRFIAAITGILLAMPWTVWGDTISKKSRSWRDEYNEIIQIQDPNGQTEGKPQKQPPHSIDTSGQEELSKAPEKKESEQSGDFFVVSKSASKQYSTSAKGPAATEPALQLEEHPDGDIGPTVHEVELEETYHEEFEIYTESLEGRYFIYSNVGNMGITDQPVYVDLPGNICYTAEKDGFAYSYTSKQMIHETGTYVFYITAIKDASVPLSEQVIYETTFNFRIQPKPEKKAEETGSDPVMQHSGYENYGSSAPVLSYDAELMTGQPSMGEQSSINSGMGENAYMPPELSSEQALDGQATDFTEESIPFQEQGTESTESEPQSDGASSDPSSMETSHDAAETETGETGESEQSETGETEAVQEVPKKDIMILVSDHFDVETGMYSMPLQEERVFLSNVPNGMITNTAVIVDLSHSGLDQPVQILKNGEPYPMPEDGTFLETGSYQMFFSTAEKEALFSFRILGSAASGLDIYTIPQEMNVVRFTRDEKDLMSEIKANRLDMRADGYYIIQMQNKEGALYGISVTIDHEPPTFTAQIAQEAAQFSFAAEDVLYVEVEKDGTIETYDGLSQLSGSGTYHVRAVDEAGNVYEQVIIIPAKLNMATVLAVILSIALLVTGVLFIRKTKKNFHVT